MAGCSHSFKVQERLWLCLQACTRKSYLPLQNTAQLSMFALRRKTVLWYAQSHWHTVTHSTVKFGVDPEVSFDVIGTLHIFQHLNFMVKKFSKARNVFL